MTYAYGGRILRVDLSTKAVTKEETEKYAREFLGGRGINEWILYNEVKKGISPFDPDNRLLFGTGVLVGTPVLGACRFTVESKNVYTAGVGSANCGGHFGPELKFAGYDNVVIQGRSDQPCYLWINDSRVEMRKARHLWGKTTWETDDIIREELRDEDIQIASIGPAGENLVTSACIITNNGRAAGKCGLGAVMGSKNLKAVAVRGSGEVSVARPEEFMSLVERQWQRFWETLKLDQQRGGRFGKDFVPKQNEWSGNPVRNFQDGFWDPEKVEQTSTHNLEKYTVRRLACFACPKACSRYLRVAEGEFKGVEGEGYYVNTLRNFGCHLDIGNLEAIIKAHMLCSQYGLDVDGTAGSIAWAMECYQRGILTKRDTGGLELKWGDYKVVLELLELIAFRKGFGDLLAECCKKASERIGRGSDQYCMHLKGQDLYEPLRTTRGYGFGVIVSPIGGGHLRGATLYESMGLTEEEGLRSFGIATVGDRKAYEGKAQMCIYLENLKAVLDSLGVCVMQTNYAGGPRYSNLSELAELLAAATGRALSVSQLTLIGERIHNIEKAFNIREGMTRKDDYPPQRFFEPIPSGPGKGECWDREKLDRLLNEYYTLRGWDAKTGLPRRSTLRRLDLQAIADELKLDSN